MNEEQAHTELAATYAWFAKESPGTVVREVGVVAALWAIIDRAVLERSQTLTYEETVAEYGYATAVESGLWG
jgi:hypothetical protein